MDFFPGPPPGLDLTETRAPALVVATCLTWVMGLVCVGLRFLSRKLTRSGFWWDDWIILTSLIWSTSAVFLTTCYMVPRGLGLHIWAAPVGVMRSYSLAIFIATFTFAFSSFTTKSAILAFYWRIFRVDTRIRWPLIILFLLVSAWTIIVILVDVLQCHPTSAFWTRFDPINAPDPSEYECGVDLLKFVLVNSFFNTVTDILLLALPLPFIWNLTLLKSQKVALLGIFALGLFVTGVSIFRIYFTIIIDFRNPDFLWPASQATKWTLVEVNIAVVCACLPSLKPIMTLALRGRVHNTESASSRGRHGSSGKRSSAFDSTRHSSRTFPPNHFVEGPSVAPLRALASTANDTQVFARPVEHDSDADEDIQMAELVWRNPNADVEGWKDSEPRGIMVTKTFESKAENRAL